MKCPCLSIIKEEPNYLKNLDNKQRKCREFISKNDEINRKNT